MKINKCQLGKHKDRLLWGGKRVECEVCGDQFPCAHVCEHLDCCAEREEPGSIITKELGLEP